MQDVTNCVFLRGTSVDRSAAKDGASNIAWLDIEGNHYRELTGDDKVDSAPTWIPGDEHALLYQSAGLARSRKAWPPMWPAMMGDASIVYSDGLLGAGSQSTLVLKDGCWAARLS